MKLNLQISDLKKGGHMWGATFIDMRKSYFSKDAGKDVISVVYKKGSNSTAEQMKNGGIEINFAPRDILPSDNKASFGCKIKYPTNFDFTRGGKTGIGFSIGNGPASGGRRSDNASSARIMWRADGAATLYLYTPTNLHQLDSKLDEASFGGGWGVEFFKDVFSVGTLKRGEWNNVSIQVILNSFDTKGFSNPDGIVIMSVNGVSASLGGIRWLSSPDKIYQCPVNSFFGGEEWFASKDEVVLYKDFWISN